MAGETIHKTLILLTAVTLAGCSTPSPTLVPYTHPERLYLQESPYTRLYVEIDRMEGASLPGFFVDRLRAFLGEQCRKPDGIEVILNSPIPLAEFEGIPLSMASLLCVDGPPAGDPPPAYLHLFVYDGRILFKGAARNPRVAATCVSAIFWNVDYARSWPEQTKTDMLEHELGHVVGLCQNTDHGDGAHCENDGCLMCPTPDLLSSLGGMIHLYYRDHRLCDDCRHDLELARQTARDANLSFAGPFLVRQEDGYSVASLPYYDAIVGDSASTEFDWRKALAQAKAGIRQVLREAEKEGRGLKPEGGMSGFYDRPMVETDPVDLERDIAVLSKAIHDPSSLVGRFASRILKRRQEALDAQPR